MFACCLTYSKHHIIHKVIIFIGIIIIIILLYIFIPCNLYHKWNLHDHNGPNGNTVMETDSISNDTNEYIARSNFTLHDTNSSIDNIDQYIQLLLNTKMIKSEKLKSNKKYEINNKFIINISDRLIIYELCKTAQGYGNGLSVYWGVRSLSFWMNYKFAIQCDDYFKHLEKKKLMSAFLPFKTNITHSSNKKNEIYYPLIDRVPKQHTVIHTTSLLLLYYNQYFQKIMHSEMKTAIIDYYNFNDKTVNNNFNKNDITIHIRCGDVLQIMHKTKNWDYGFLTLNYYKYIMNVTNWKSKITENTTIYILSQLNKKGVRKGEIQTLNDCNYLINYIVDNGLNKIFKPGKIKIMYDTDVNDDYYRMLNTPFLICSPSTFCFNVGAANINAKYVIIPNRGAWFNFINIDPNYRNNFTINNQYIIAKNSKLIPSNQLIIDTDIFTNWHCNKIPYKNRNGYNQFEFTKQLAQYLVIN